MIVEDDPRQPGLARPARARRRRGPCARPRRAPRRAPPGDRPPGDPRPRLRHRGDGPLARAAAARPAALGRARPGRRPARGRRRRPARPGRRRGRGHRRGEAVRHHPAAPRRSRRRDPHHRLGAARPADRRRAGRAGHRLRRRRLSRAADPVRRRSRRPDPGGSARLPRGRGIRRPPAPHDRAGPPARPGRRRGRRRGVRPAGGRGPRPAQPLATRRLRGRPGGGVVHRVGGRRVRAAGRAGRRDRRLRAPASGGGRGRTARRHRGPRRPAGPARERETGATDEPDRVGVGPPRGRRRDVHRPGLAPGHGPVPRRHPHGRRPGAGGSGGPRGADHRVLRLAVEDRGPWSRHRPAAARCGGGVLPVAVPQRHAARRGRGRRPPRGQPRSRRQRCRPRVAGRRVGTLRRAGRAGRPDRRRSARAAVARAARPCRWSRSRSSWRCSASCSWLGRAPAAVASRWARVRSAVAGDIRDGLLAAQGVARHRARVCAGRRRPRGHVPDRRADRGHHRAAVADAAAGVARDAGHGAAQRRRLGAARGRDGMGVRRGRPGCGRRASPPPSSTASWCSSPACRVPPSSWWHGSVVPGLRGSPSRRSRGGSRSPCGRTEHAHA